MSAFIASCTSGDDRASARSGGLRAEVADPRLADEILESGRRTTGGERAGLGILRAPWITRRLAPDPSGNKRLEPGPRGSCNPVDRGRPPTVLAPARGETRAGRPLSIESPIPSDAEVAGACPIDRPLLVGGESDFFVDRSRWLLAPPTGDGRGGAVSGRGMEVRNTPFPDDAGGCSSRSSTPGTSSGFLPFP